MRPVRRPEWLEHISSDKTNISTSDTEVGGHRISDDSGEIAPVEKIKTPRKRRKECWRQSFRPSGFGEQAWRRDRHEALSEIRFKPKIWLLTFVYETFPTFLSCWLCLAVEGRNACYNRQLWPFTPAKLLGLVPSLLVGFLLPIHLMLLLWFVLQPPDVSIWDVFVTYSFVWIRAACIASKYAYFGEKDLDATTGIRSSYFAHSHRAARKLGTNWMANLNGAQGATICEELYLACLRCDTDLRKIHFFFEEESVARCLSEQCDAIWESAAAQMEKAHITLDKNPLLDRRRLAVLVPPPDELEFPPSAFDFKLGDCQRLLNSNIDTTGHVSALALALKLADDHFYVTDRDSRFLFRLPMLVALLFCGIPPLVRAYGGHAPFGNDARSKVVFGLQLYCHFWYIALFVGFVGCAMSDSSRRRCMMDSLREMVRDGIVLEGRQGNRICVSPDQSTHSHASIIGLRDTEASCVLKQGHIRLRVDLSMPRNIIAYRCLRRVLGGGEFGRSFYMRYQCFVLIFFAGLLLQTGCQSVTAWLRQEKLELDAYVTALCTACAILLGIAYCMANGYLCNKTHHQLLMDLDSEQLSLYAWLENRHDDPGSPSSPRSGLSKESAKRAIDVLDRLKAAVETEGSTPEALQLNVMFMPAEVRSITLLATFIATACYFQIQDILSGNGFKLSDFG